MTTEEVALTPALQEAGLSVLETDLGEFIVQIDNDRPSHIVTPIIHKNRKVIATAMARELGVEYTEDPETLTMYARRHLREAFRNCDLGVSGANFAAADTGTVCVCTNEGNGRLTTTRPKVHVVLMGIEKVIPRLADLAVFLKLLARSSTGQPITVYTSLTTGPRRPGDADGPEELHVILLDNGRSSIRFSEYRQALRCIRCGACLNACPVFRQIGGHAYGSTYPGPIGSLISPLLAGFDRYLDLPRACSLCGFCREVCPVNIDIPELLVRLRRDQVDRRKTGLLHRTAFRVASAMLANPVTYRIGQRAARWLTRFGSDGEWITKAPPPLGKMTEHHDWPRPAPIPFRRLIMKTGQVQFIRGRWTGGTADVTDVCTSRYDSTGQLIGPVPFFVRRVGVGEDLVSMFCQRAQSLGMYVSRTTVAQVGRHIAEVLETLDRPAALLDALRQRGVDKDHFRWRAWLEPELFCTRAITDALGQAVDFINPDDGDDAIFAADVGITGVESAVAETGSILCTSGQERWRGMSLIPPVHVAVVQAERIVPDLLDVFTTLSDSHLPAGAFLISGPSKTADIEGILITGVHGPGAVHVCVVE